MLRLTVLLTLAFPAAAEPAGGEEQTCPWCRNDPALLAAMGAVSHGPFELGNATTTELAERLPGDWVFFETEHFRFASSLGPERLSAAERKRMEPELERLRAQLPDLPQKVKKLDPWLRLHLLAMRSEEFYDRFQALLGVTDADFPESRAPEGPFMGDGRYLGEKNKFQVLFHARRATHRMFTRETMGVQVTDALRWHLPNHTMLASIPAEDGDLRETRWLFAHAVHLYSHLFLCAYKHFSYDPPIWLDEGLAHTMEREVEPLSTTMDGDEGAGPHRGDRRDWSDEDERLVSRDEATSLAELMRVSSFGDLSIEDHVSALSLVRFMLAEHPEKLAAFLGAVKGQLDERGYPTGRDLQGLQRRAIEELWGWNVLELDAAWRTWVRERE
jgi:hypothetical protein